MTECTIYQAGPLFTDAEKYWHKNTKAKLEAAGFSVIWPGEVLTAERIDAAGPEAPALIFAACKGALDQCGCIVALLDGTQVDDGTAWEIGYAHAKGMPVYSIRTDSRVAGDTKFSRLNGMIEGCLAGLVKTVPELITVVGKS